jgi:excisionase family DNA binding protein
MTSASASKKPESEWLSLREAAELLGMNPATVRLWADRNLLPSRRTSGGHRRFRRADIEAHLRQEAERKPRPAAQLLVQSVLGRVREAWAEGVLATLPWHRHFDEPAREAYRRLGRRLLELLLHALTEPSSYPNLLQEAASLGHEYGSITRASHVPVADAVRAFLYFRSLVDETLIQLAEVQAGREHQDLPWAESLYQIQQLTNEILPALIEAALAEASPPTTTSPPSNGQK